MKKIFTLLTMALLALGMNAESLIDFAQTKNGITVGGTCEFSSVKIHTNTDSKECIKFANGYTTDSELNGNLVTLEVEGGFKAGDVVSIAGVFNNSDDSKSAAVALFVLDSEAENGYTVLWETENFINGRTVAADPAVQTFTLTADADKLFLGRKGNTATCVTTLKVVRGEETSIGDDPVEPAEKNGLIDYPTSQDGITLGGTCSASTVKIHTNTDEVACVKFSNGYTTDSKLNANIVTLETEGGFKAGDVVSIAGVFSNSDDTKNAAVALFVLDAEAEYGYTVLWETENFINGRTVADDPAVQTYTLTADADKLLLGRKGNTATCVTKLNITRGSETGIIELPVSVKQDGAIYNLSGQRVDENYRGVVIMNGKKVVK